MCLKYKNPSTKLVQKSRPSTAVHRSGRTNPEGTLKSRNIDTGIMRDVLQSIGIFIPYDQYQIMLNAFQLSKKKFLSYGEFMKVFAKTHYPQPFIRSSHLENSGTPVPDYSSTPSATDKTTKFYSEGIGEINSPSTTGTHLSLSGMYSAMESHPRRGLSMNSKTAISRNQLSSFKPSSTLRQADNSASTKMLASRNNILSNKNPIIATASLKSMVKDSATMKEVVKEEKVYQK